MGECDQCSGILDELENIDDDCDRHGITFVKTQDYSIAELYGISDYPVLVYFEGNVPNVYEGSLREEEEVLQWLIQQKTEDRIELITRVMLESMVEETQYLAVYFCKYSNDKPLKVTNFGLFFRKFVAFCYGLSKQDTLDVVFLFKCFLTPFPPIFLSELTKNISFLRIFALKFRQFVC